MDKSDFLRAICHDVHDDLPRLVFADWLEEQGNSERAEFIRLQVERASDGTGDRGRPELVEREHELFLRHKNEWLAELPDLPGVSWGDRIPQSHVDPVHHFHRGFVFHVWVKDLEAFERHAYSIHKLTTARSLCFQLPDDMESLPSFFKSAYQINFDSLRIHGTANARMEPKGMRLLTASPYAGRLTSLYVGHHALTDEGVALLADAACFSALRDLGVAGNGLTSAGLISLANSPHLSQLRCLDVSGFAEFGNKNPHRFDPASLAVLGHASLSGHLDTLWLRDIDLEDTGATALATGSFPRLRSLDLRCNRMTDIGARALAHSEMISGVRELYLGNNPLGTAGVLGFIKIASLQHLHTLDLNGTDLGTEAVYLLGGSKMGQNLGQLNLCNNPIGLEGMRFFLERRFWPRLVRLDLSFQPHERDVAESLKEAWGDHLELHFRGKG